VSSTIAAEDGMVDPFSPEFFVDPYARFAAARDLRPVQRHPTGTWMVFRHDDVVQVLRDRALSSSEQYALDAPRNQAIRAAGGTNDYLLRPSLSKMDAPDHTPLRSLLARMFTPRAMEALRHSAGVFVTETLDAYGGEDMELIDTLGYPLPYRLTCHWLGVPILEDNAAVRQWSFKGLHLLDPFRTPDHYRDYIAAGGEFAAYLREVVEWKRQHLGPDAISRLIAAGDDGRVITPDQVAATVHTLFLAGFHTTVNQIGLSLLALFGAPDQWSALVDDESLLPNAVEELLRFDPTAQFMIRATPTDYSVGGVVVPAGHHVLAWIASANRDERRWGATADQLDLTRPDARNHIAFGSGIHSCLGMWLARLELEEVLRGLLRRFPNTRLVDDRPQWRSTAFIRGLDTLHLHLAA
jgi:cytochrome P450